MQDRDTDISIVQAPGHLSDQLHSAQFVTSDEHQDSVWASCQQTSSRSELRGKSVSVFVNTDAHLRMLRKVGNKKKVRMDSNVNLVSVREMQPIDA